MNQLLICNKAETCLWHKRDKERGHGCGGAVPHECGSECGKCPCDEKAKCVPVESKGMDENMVEQ